MAIAGKVAITLSEENNGKWSASVTYDKLVAVTHNNNLYISKKTSTNEEPTVTNEFWFLALEGFSGETLDGILDGTVAVGNALKLDGHEAEYFAPKADLAKYLPLTGGDIDGNISIHGDRLIQFWRPDGNRSIALYGSASAGYGIHSSMGQGWVMLIPSDGSTPTFNGTASGNLPLTGGTVTKNGTKVMGIHNTNSLYTLFEFYGQGSELGSIGFDGVNNLVFRPVESGTKNIFHTGNKPTGTYTGNGSNEQRTVNVGGTGSALLIFGSGYSMFATPSGAIGLQHSGGNIIVVPQTECKYLNGTLTLATANYGLNANNATYNYQVL